MMKVMFNNTNTIYNNYLTCLKKIMKRILFIALLSTSLSSYAQYNSFSYATAYDNINYDLPENFVPALILPTLAIGTISYKYTESFQTMTIKDRNQTMLTGYLSTVIITTGTHFIIKYFRTHKTFKTNRKYKRKYY